MTDYLKLVGLLKEFDCEFVEQENEETASVLLYQGMWRCRGDYGLYMRFDFNREGEFQNITLKEE